MKNKLQLTNLRHLIGLFTALLSLLFVSQSAWAWTIYSGAKIYFVDNDSWGACYMYYWGSNWNNNQQYTKIANTLIYYNSFSSNWTGLTGIKFHNSSTGWAKQSTGDICMDISGNVYFAGSSTTKNTDMTKLNGTAKLVLMVSEDGNTYTNTANASCVAKISGYNLTGGATSTTAVNSSTGSSSEVSIYPAYGSTITYSLTSSGDYEFKGFSTKNQSSLPSDVAQSKTQTAKSLGGNCTTYYAYFAKSCDAPTVTTGTATVTGSTTATLAGTFTEGETDVTEAGFAISKSLSSGFTNYEGTIDGSDVTLAKTGLDADTKYYYKSYVIDGCGTFYGSETKNFTTYQKGPDYLFIKGPLINTEWGSYTMDHSATPIDNVYTFKFNATNATKSGEESNSRFFVLSTKLTPETKIQGQTEYEEGNGWSFSTDGNNSFIADADIVTSTSTPIIITVTYHEATTGYYTMKVEPDCTEPTAYEVSGTAEICSGSSTNVTLGNSQTDYTYELYKDGTATGTTQPGTTGSALNFSVSEAGEYTIKGYDTATEGCLTDMTGSATITNKGASVEQSPADAHSFESVTFTASTSTATWSIQTRPDGVSEVDAYLSATSGKSITFNGKNGAGYVIRAIADDCDTDTQFDVAIWPDKCN